MDHEEVQPADRELRVLRGVEPALRPAAVGLDHRRLVHRARHLRVARQEPCRAPVLARDIGRREHRLHRLLQVRRVPAAELAGADGIVRHRLRRRRPGTSCCRSASRSTRSSRCPTRSTSTSGAAKPIPKFLDYALFVTFFPHLVAGPIVRPTQLVPQFEAPRQATRDQILWGLGAADPRPVREGRDRRCRPRERRRRGVRRARTGRLRRRLARHARLLGPDLLRLRRLLDGRDRRLAVPRLRAARQLPHAVRGDRLLRFLAALAHLALDLAARLPVRPARRQSRRPRSAPTST